MNSRDEVEIIGIINLYAFMVDSQQWSLFDQVFCVDVMADFGGGAVWEDRDSFKRDFVAVHTPFDSTQHMTSNHVVRVRAEQAYCVSYVHGRFIRKVEGGHLFESTGWYDDLLVKTEEGWRISKRVCRSVWADGNPRVMETLPGISGVPQLYSLKVEAESGAVRFLQGL